MKDSNMKETIIRLWSYLKKEKKNIIVVVILTILSTFASILSPFLLSKIIDEAIPNANYKKLLFFLSMLLFTYLIHSLFTWITNHIMTYVSEQTLYLIRKDLFEHLEELPLSYFDNQKKGDIMSRFTNDISVISDTLSDFVIDIVNSIITLIGVTIMMLWMSIPLFITVIITVPIFFLLVYKIGMKVNRYFTEQQDNIGEITGYAEEYISGMKLIKSVQKEEEVIKDFQIWNKKLCDSSVNAQTYASMIIPANAVITNIGNILLIGVGAFLVLKGKTTLGSILAFLNYASMFRNPINSLASLFANMQSAIAGAKRVFEVIDIPSEFRNEAIETEEHIKGEIIFDDVTFEYENGKNILKNINFQVHPGEKIAIVGPTGSGKTTLINLLNRFYEVNIGNIIIDGKSIKDISKKTLRKNIGLVLQDTYLFQASVLENIRYGHLKANKRDVIEASKKAMAHAFIHRLPDGYESAVEEEGNNFSQGERQLLSIARTILENPKILILDEATSNIDTRTEQLVQKGMIELMKDKTCFIIAHRLSTIRDADRIIVLKDGQIVEVGTHVELIQKRQFYYELYNSQFNN